MQIEGDKRKEKEKELSMYPNENEPSILLTTSVGCAPTPSQ